MRGLPVYFPIGLNLAVCKSTKPGQYHSGVLTADSCFPVVQHLNKRRCRRYCCSRDVYSPAVLICFFVSVNHIVSSSKVMATVFCQSTIPSLGVYRIYGFETSHQDEYKFKYCELHVHIRRARSLQYCHRYKTYNLIRIPSLLICLLGGFKLAYILIYFDITLRLSTCFCSALRLLYTKTSHTYQTIYNTCANTPHSLYFENGG